MNLKSIFSILKEYNFYYFRGNISDSNESPKITFTTNINGDGSYIIIEFLDNGNLTVLFWIKKKIFEIFKETYSNIDEKKFLELLKEHVTK